MTTDTLADRDVLPGWELRHCHVCDAMFWHLPGPLPAPLMGPCCETLGGDPDRDRVVLAEVRP